MSQKYDLQRWWKDSVVSYGNRWIAETVFSVIKEHLLENMFILLNLRT